MHFFVKKLAFSRFFLILYINKKFSKVMKYKKKIANLNARIKAYENLKGKQGYTKPGSQKK